MMKLPLYLWLLIPLSLNSRSEPPSGSGVRKIMPLIEAEEEVYPFELANNGAGPLWCNGSTCLVDVGGRVFASGLETLSDAKPLNNCRWTLFERAENHWELVQADPKDRTREPCPLAMLPPSQLFLSANPTLLVSREAYSGPARPEILRFDAAHPKNPADRLIPVWSGQPKFTEHSYRSFAADAANGELLLLQNIDYDRAEWSFYDRHQQWSAHGQLRWPWESAYEKPQPLRLCYPNVAVRNRAVHFCGVQDIVEPIAAWRAFKKQQTGQEWDYVFRRLFYSWCPQITDVEFKPWIELSNLEKTAGAITLGDLWIAPTGAAHIIWTERRIDERLRPRFIAADEKQQYSLEYAVIDRGQVVLRKTLISRREGEGSLGRARFQATPDHRLLVVFFQNAVSPGNSAPYQDSVFEIYPGGSMSSPVGIPLENPMNDFFTATPRAGSPESNVLEMLGQTPGKSRSIRYARVRLVP